MQLVIIKQIKTFLLYLLIDQFCKLNYDIFYILKITSKTSFE